MKEKGRFWKEEEEEEAEETDDAFHDIHDIIVRFVLIYHGVWGGACPNRFHGLAIDNDQIKCIPSFLHQTCIFWSLASYPLHCPLVLLYHHGCQKCGTRQTMFRSCICFTGDRRRR